MPLDREGFTLVTSAETELRRADVPAVMVGEWAEHPNGARGRMDHLALLTFTGVPSNRMQEQTRVRRRVDLALPDLVELRDGLEVVIRQAVDAGLLELP